MSIDYAARVAKGAALLDEKKPGWVDLIDLDKLNVQSSYACVTAQLSGSDDYYTGMQQLGLTHGDGGTYVAHGFNAESEDWAEESADAPEGYDQDEAYDTLNTLWRGLITGRREDSAPKV